MSGDDDELDAALQAFGLALHLQPQAEPVCEVWPEHVDALHLFSACMDQLQVSIGMGGGRWGAAPSASVAQEARWLGIHGKRQAVVALQYRVMEREALRIINEREERAAKKA